MTGSSLPSLESLEYLFQPRSQLSKQVSPHAPFEVSRAVSGKAGFHPQTSPSQAPKKRKILLDFNSCLRLWNPHEMALEIAKLKVEGFEVAFILKGENEGDIFESPIEDKAEGDKKYDYKFKDKNGQDKSIFELSDEFIKENFSELNHEISIEKLNLTRDESIILSYEQFEKIDKIFNQKYWADKERVSVRSSLSYSFLDGAVKKRESYESIVASLRDDGAVKKHESYESIFASLRDDGDDNSKTLEKLKNLLTHEDFNIEDKDTLDALTNLLKINSFNDFRSLFYEIKNEKILEALFDKIPSLTFFDDETENKNKKISLQKKILANLWYRHSNFETVLAKARTLEEFNNKTDKEIAEEIYTRENLGDIPRYAVEKSINLESTPSNIIERINIVNLNYFETNTLKKFFLFIVAEQKKGSFNKNIEFNVAECIKFNFPDYTTKELLCEIHISSGKEKTIIDFEQYAFMDLFSDPEFNQHFNLTEKFGDAIIDYFGKNSFSKICDLSRNKGFFEQLNDDQKKRFTDILEEKISSAQEVTLWNCGTLQHHLHLPKIKELAKSMLLSKTIKFFPFSDLTPAFQDLLIEMHEEEKIDLTKIELPKESKLSAKFENNRWKSLNYNSSQDLDTSPLQITLFDLTEESLKKIKEKIDSGELDPSKILSVDVFGIERAESGKENKEKEELLIDFLKLFPHLKHAKIDTKDIYNGSPEGQEGEKLKLRLNELNITTLDIHNSTGNINKTIATAQNTSPEFQFTATKTGDAIFMGNARSSGAYKEDSQTTFSMKEAGKIIQRPAYNQESLYIRYASRKLSPNFGRLQDNLFVDIDESQAISSKESASIIKFSKPDFEAKKTALASTPSQNKTICSFSKTLKSGEKTALSSISPDNKIIGYFTEPSSADVQFFKDESGFYYAKTNKRCKIHYLIEGQELKLQTPNKNLKDLPENVQKVITDYVGKNSANFPLSVRHDQYQLPAFSTKKQFLDELFNLENKGSCRHRVSALAHKFEEAGLECGKDFRIIGVNGNHELLEVKKQNSDEWVTLDLGGEEAKQVKKKNFFPKSITRTFNNAISCLHSFNLSFNFSNFSCFPSKTTKLNPSTSPQSPSIEKIPPALSILESELDKLHQLKKVENLQSFEENFEQFVIENKSSALLLKTSYSEELKNHLLRMSSSSKNPSNPDSTDSALTSSSLSFQAFYASSPQDLTAKKPTLHIGDNDKTVKITAETPLLSFLENAQQYKDKQHVLIIDWGKFDASSQVAFNTMFDKGARKIDDQEIPENVKIVCIDNSKQQTTDSSILSRFSEALDLSSIQKTQFAKSKIEASLSLKATQEIACDGEGLVNWKEKLFGRIIVDGDAIKWEKTDFVKSLEAFGKEGTDGSNPDQTPQKDLQLNFKNFSLTQQQEMKIFFEQAKALGSIDYQDYKITIPQDLSIKFAQKEFEFTEVLKSFKPSVSESSSPSSSPDSKQLQLTIYKNSLASNKLPKDIHLINSHLFDQLLTQPQIDRNQYQEKAGLIESASTSDSKNLKLFLSEDLTKQQLYCLLNQAQEHQVALELYMAKDVKIPDTNLKKFTEEFKLDKSVELTGGEDPAGGVGFKAIRTSRKSSPSPESPSSTPQSRIIITNNIEESLKELIKAIESTNSQSHSAKTINLVNVEDILYGDLFGKNQHKIVAKEDGSQHFAFEKIETAVKDKLKAGETVILKGEFSDELLSLLHPQILDLQKEFSNLHFIIEDKNVSKSKLQSSKLSWLDPSLYKVEYSPEITKKTTEEKIAREVYPTIESSIPDDSKAQADNFIKGRKDKLLEFLQDNPILQIFGHSGVGKSSLLRELKENGLKTQDDVAVYNELSSLEAWTQDKSKDKTKILVIDEFNIDDTHFTLFRDLANNPKTFPREIFHDGKSFTLTQNHKVVFLGNPPNYGNRFTQKLFEDCDIPQWHLQDFPIPYIYENILAKPIYEGLSAESKRKLSQEDFKEIALEEIKNYKAKNQGDPQTKDILPSETVRELQEKVLKEIVKKISPIEASQVQNANFIATEANQESIAELQSAIEIRKLQKDGKLPPQFLGTCGVIFEGDSGVGKSVMIEAVLKERGITKIDSLENLAQEIAIEKTSEITPAKKPHYYYKIPASLPIKEIEENLIKAFELGVIVVFDEMNTRIKEGGLEKTINALLTGQHPQNPKIKPQAGFMIIASVNKATNAGRSAISPAIIHRSTIIKAKSLSEYKAQDFEKIIGNWAENAEKEKDKIGKEKISFAEKSNQAEIKEASEAIADLVQKQPEKFKNLRDLKKIMPEILKKLREDNQLIRSDSSRQ